MKAKLIIKIFRFFQNILRKKCRYLKLWLQTSMSSLPSVLSEAASDPYPPAIQRHVSSEEAEGAAVGFWVWEKQKTRNRKELEIGGIQKPNRWDDAEGRGFLNTRLGIGLRRRKNMRCCRLGLPQLGPWVSEGLYFSIKNAVNWVFILANCFFFFWRRCKR